ncbi:MAG: hypothetical protein J6J23_02590 [Clostridia bacterium]|nr:hypothetical protein [Clostridia bacterium]
MTMREYFEMGYKVVCESMFGDVEMEDMDMVKCYEEDSEFDRVDEESKVVYFTDAQDYDD